MSIKTFTVRPWAQDEINTNNAKREEFGYNQQPYTTFTCSYCGSGVKYTAYTDHVAKYHRMEGGHIYKPFPKSKPNAVLVFAEWQQSDAIPEDLQ